MNDETALALRTLKDSAGNYLWKDINETIFSKPVQIVDSMPSIGKGQKVIAFGDFSNYWLVQRFPMTIRTPVSYTHLFVLPDSTEIGRKIV